MLSALAIAGSAKADTLVVIPSTHAIEDARANAQARSAQQQAEQQALASWFETLPPNVIPHDPYVRAQFYDWLKRKRELNEEKKRIFAVDQLLEGDPIALSNRYDDEATIRIYLHNSGYIDLSDTEITMISTYMRDNHVRHISELGINRVSELVTKFRSPERESPKIAGSP